MNEEVAAECLQPPSPRVVAIVPDLRNYFVSLDYYLVSEVNVIINAI